MDVAFSVGGGSAEWKSKSHSVPQSCVKVLLAGVYDWLNNLFGPARTIIELSYPARPGGWKKIRPNLEHCADKKLNPMRSDR